MKEENLISLLRSEATRAKAYETLVHMYQEKLYWHIRKMVGSHADADDVLQNTFIKVWQHLGRFRGDSKIYTWLYRIATNECYTFLQKEKKRQTPVSSEPSLTEQLPSDPYFEGREMELKLWQAIDQLPARQKEVFLLKYFEAMKYGEMADLLQTSTGALKASYHHAVQKIRHFLKTH